MGLLVPSALPVLWVLGCFSLLLWLWALCTACHRKQAQRKQARRRGSVVPVEMVSARLSRGQSRTSRGPTSILYPQSLRRTYLCSLSKSDTRLHELHRGKHYSTAPRPASMDLRPLWLEMSRGSTRLQATSSTFLPQQLPRAPAITATAPTEPTGPEATYSNVGLATTPRASLVARPVVWGGTQLISCDRLGPRTRPTVAKYACIQKCKGPQEPQGEAEVTPATQDILYSKICKPKHRNPELSIFQPDPQGQGVVPAPRRGLAHEDTPPQDLGMDQGPSENVYESIQEMGL
ncbi:lck-interacting transmembrane adapter 1 [Perognathus longimembris pacificus]|uniref:lck-interacting transmembrane adapter 1 n=1 Tax=Perognathus longimembris pacificus TaxID=214514 RepID=UPI002018A493|nr:lck-interacting transmembrane adapter 1 [Perognathus longimembris pacificus]